MRPLRPAVLAIALIAAAGAPGSAHAGIYDVIACDAAGGANNSWVPIANHPKMAPYNACPSSGNRNNGLVARNVIVPSQSSERVPYGAFAMQRFDAPAGTSIVGITASYRMDKNTDEVWNVGLSTGGAFLRGCEGKGGSHCFAQGVNDFIPVPSTSLIYWEASCWNWNGCSIADSLVAGDSAVANARVYSAAVQIEDSSAPSVSFTGGSLISGGWKSGVQDVSFHADDNVGIRETKARSGQYSLGGLARGCDHTRVIPCPQGGDRYELDTANLRPDGKHSFRVEAVDSAGNGAHVEREILIDNTAPAPPEQLAIVGGDGWRSANDFRLTWRNPSEPGTAPIAAVAYRLCPASGTECQTGERLGAEPTSLSLKVPGPGEYVARVWLRDEAGNANPAASAHVWLRFDDGPPALAFERPEPDRPTALQVAASDDLSGVTYGEIEIRRRGTDTWRALETHLEPGTLVAVIPDEGLEDGPYELRARARDSAGNERSTDRRRDGTLAEIVLPLRVKTQLRAGAVAPATRRIPGRRARLRNRVRARYGTPVRLAGRLTNPDRSAIVGAEILVLQAPADRDASFTPLAALTTSRTGRFSYVAPKGTSRTLRFRFPGTPTIRPAVSDVQLGVLAATTAHTDRRFLLNGESVRFFGRLLGQPVPTTGKLLEIQAYVRRRWRTFGTARAGSGGTWRYEYRFDGTRGLVVYRFRVRIPREVDYPYEAGVSRQLRVRVRGL